MQVIYNALRVVRIGALKIVTLSWASSRLFPAGGVSAAARWWMTTRYNASRTPLAWLLCLHLLNAANAVGLNEMDRLQMAEADAAMSLSHRQPDFLPNRTGIVELFEWKFADIARECMEFLGPRGYAGVQVSPVTEHLVVRSASDSMPRHPWWARYQPLSLRIASRSGSVAEFAEMTHACNAAGVRVYVDVVLNHLAGAYDAETANGERLLEGYAGALANASSYDYPAIPFTRTHFHKPCALANFADAQIVRNCQLNGWPDLNLDHMDVRGNLTEFLNDLVDLGVAGFRVDAAKYMWPIDIKLLFEGVKNLNSEAYDFPEHARPFVYQDVVDLGIDAVSKTEYSSYALVTDYLYPAVLANIINGKAPLSTLINWGPAMGFLQHQQVLVFVDSHDAQRDSKLLGANRLISYKQPRKYIIAVAFMLAHPYGRVKRIMSSYYFASEQPEQGPPMVEVVEKGEGEAAGEKKAVGVEGEGGVVEAEAEAKTAEAETAAKNKAEQIVVKEAETDEAVVEDADEEDSVIVAIPPSPIRSPTFDPTTGRCEYESGWVCEHRWPPIVNMIELVNTLDEVEDGVMNFQTDGPNHIAFCRGEKAFFAFNNDPELTYDAEVVTCLPSGVYCDVITGGRAVVAGDADTEAEAATDCVGKRIVVGAEGKAHIVLPAVLSGGEEEAAAGSDYDAADVEANDAYAIAEADNGEFCVLAIYVGARLGGEVEKKAEEGNAVELSNGDKDEKENEVKREDEKDKKGVEDAEDLEDNEDVEGAKGSEGSEGVETAEEKPETSDEGKEVISAEELEGAEMLKEKNGKLTAEVNDASVENAAGEEDNGEGGEGEEQAANEANADKETDTEKEAAAAEGEETSKDDEEKDIAVADEPAPADNPTEGEDASVAHEDDKEKASEDDTEKANESGESESNSEAENTRGEESLEEGKNKLGEVGKEVTKTLEKAEGEIAEHISEMPENLAAGTGVKFMAEGFANNTKKVLAKAGFNTNDATRQQSERYALPSAKAKFGINPP